MDLLKASKASELTKNNQTSFNQARALDQLKAFLEMNIRKSITLGLNKAVVTKISEHTSYPEHIWDLAVPELISAGYNIVDSGYALTVCWK